MPLTSYRRFLTGLIAELQTAIGELENMEYHHAVPGSPQYAHYSRVANWLSTVEERMVWYDGHKAPRI